MAHAELTYAELVKRLEEAEDLIGALISSQADALVSQSGVHVLRLRETDRALHAAKQGLEKMLEQRTEELRQSEQRLRRIYDSGMVGVFSWTGDGRITDANDRFLEMVGYSRHELQSKQLTWIRITPPEYQVADSQAFQRLSAAGVDSSYEKEYLRKDGTRIPVLISSATVQGARDTGISVVLDITPHKRAERALIRSEKLASVGRMAATVAHEINNPLELILNCVYLASLDKNLTREARQCLDSAEKELVRVAQLTRRTLGFYRENTMPTSVNPSVVINEVLDMYAPRLLQRGITIRSEHDTNLQVTIVPGELRQVISNILTNAIDASVSGCHIRIRTNCARWNGDGWVRLTFADTGEGIPAENLKRIFEPFFTTKESVGTGLGLWIAHEIVKRHQGRLRVRSRRGHGTVFSILLKSATVSTACPGEKEAS